MKWVMEGKLEDGLMLFTGTGWTTRAALAVEYDTPDHAQDDCDGLHLADCLFNHVKARETKSKFRVIDIENNVLYSPKPLVKDKTYYKREK
jgi:hypothetical protein